MSSETMNAENMNDDIMNLDVAVMSLYVDIHIYVIYNLIGMVRLALIFISTIFVMVGYMCSNCSVWVDKLLIYITASINITHAITSINYNIRHMGDIVSGIINRNFASLDDINEINNNLFNNGIPINVNATYIKREPNSYHESDADDSDDGEDIDGDDVSDVDDSDDGGELANLSELIPIKDETIDEYADLPELIPITDDIDGDDNSDEYADLPDLIPIDDEVIDESQPVADNKVYIDDDIQDVTDQYLAKKEEEKEANKVMVDLTDDAKNTSSDNDKNTAESI